MIVCNSLATRKSFKTSETAASGDMQFTALEAILIFVLILILLWPSGHLNAQSPPGQILRGPAVSPGALPENASVLPLPSAMQSAVSTASRKPQRPFAGRQLLSPVERFVAPEVVLPLGSTLGDGTKSEGRDEPMILSAFQRFVEQATGELLPMYGMNFFMPSQGFAPIEDSPVPSDYLLGPGDELAITISGMLEANFRVAVDRNGLIQIPKFGPLSIQGVSASKVEDHIAKALSRYFRDFQLSVTLGRLRTIDVYVVGEASRPGKWTLSSLSSLVNALFSVGGASHTGSMRSIKLRRGNQIIGDFDLYGFIRDGDTSKDRRLQSGDVIIIPPVGVRIALVGHPDKSAIFELTESERTLGGLLKIASVARHLVNEHRVVIERIDPTDKDAPRRIIEKSLLGDELQTPLQDGDIVRLLDLSPRFSNAVTLRGNVAMPIRHAFIEGMKLSDLIPETNALMDPNYFVRKNRLVQFQDAPNPSLRDTSPADRVGRADRDGNFGDRAGRVREPEARKKIVVTGFRDRIEEPHWDYAVIERLTEKELQPQLIAFSLRKLLLERDPESNIALMPGDVVTIFTKSDFTMPKRLTQRLVRIEGEVNRPGVYPVVEGESAADLFERAGGKTENAYVYATEFFRESILIDQEKRLLIVKQRLAERLNALSTDLSQNIDPAQLALAKERLEAAKSMSAQLATLKASGRLALDLEFSSANLPKIALEDGDRIYLPAMPASVSVFGAVNLDSALVYKPGRRVIDYLEQAGLRAEADRNEIFVIRANGSIKTRKRTIISSAASGIDSEELYPGDTVVVPEKLDRESAWTSFMRSARDFATVLGQLGIGAAAIKILRQ